MQCWEQGWCSCVVTCSSAGIVTGLDLTVGLSSLLPPWHLCCWLSEGSLCSRSTNIVWNAGIAGTQHCLCSQTPSFFSNTAGCLLCKWNSNWEQWKLLEIGNATVSVAWRWFLSVFLYIKKSYAKTPLNCASINVHAVQLKAASGSVLNVREVWR